MATFIFPTVTRVTSGFRGSRRNHHGVDFAQSGYHEIKASAAGKVSRSYRSSSYGECIMIVHQINGKTWETVYAHMRTGSRRVKVGDTVKQGQVIGVMGSTGNSTGQHLHFELHRGRWNVRKTNAVNPLQYLGKDSSPKKVVKDLNAIKIRKGDTLTGLAKQYDTTVKKLQEVNKIRNPNKIYVGQRIIVSAKQYHKVKRGDTVSALARKYGSSQSQIKAWNKLKDINKIKVGQRLRVR